MSLGICSGVERGEEIVRELYFSRFSFVSEELRDPNDGGGGDTNFQATILFCG